MWSWDYISIIKHELINEEDGSMTKRSVTAQNNFIKFYYTVPFTFEIFLNKFKYHISELWSLHFNIRKSVTNARSIFSKFLVSQTLVVKALGHIFEVVLCGHWLGQGHDILQIVLGQIEGQPLQIVLKLLDGAWGRGIPILIKIDLIINAFNDPLNWFCFLSKSILYKHYKSKWRQY